MLPCLIGAKYTMTADLLTQIVEQDLSSGQMKKIWVFDRKIRCYAQSIMTDAVSDASAGKKFNRDYLEYQFIKLWTMENLGKRQRLVNFRNSKNQKVWYEQDTPGQNDTLFEVQGSLPIFDMFSNLTEYEVLCKRSEVQDA